MIIIDLNVLLYAHNSDNVYHDKARQWFESVMNGDEPVAFPWVVVLGFLRISTNSRVFSSPLPAEVALEVVQEWLDQPVAKILNPSKEHWRILKSLLNETGTAGNLTTDTHLAAMAIENGCVLCSTDNDFRRFRRLRWMNPLEKK